MSLTKQLRAAIRQSGLTIYRIAKDSGIPQPTVQRFAAGKRDMYLETADKLAAYFGMRLTRPVKPAKGVK